MTKTLKNRVIHRGLLTAAVFFCLAASPVFAQEQGNEQPGFVEAMNAYNNGDMREAAQILWRLAAENDPEAQYYLATMMDSGTGTSQDIVGAVGWFRKSAEAGYMPSMVHLGYAYGTGHGVTRDDREALRWYLQAAQLGDAIAQNNLGVMLRDGLGRDANPKVAAQWFLQSALQNNTEGQYNLATAYLRGEGTVMNRKEALRWFSYAAKKGDARAQNALGAMYNFGQGVDKDPKEAREWYGLAAQQGHVGAQVALASLYKAGSGVVKADPVLAGFWFARAAKEGNTEAQVQLGNMYETGIGLQQNSKLAAHWYSKAMDDGKSILATRALCRLYEKEPTAANRSEDINEVYRQGARAGDAYCQFALGRVYRSGTRENQNLVEAYQWLALAVDALPTGDDKAAAVVARIETVKLLSEEELTNARKLVAEWKAVPLNEGR